MMLLIMTIYFIKSSINKTFYTIKIDKKTYKERNKRYVNLGQNYLVSSILGNYTKITDQLL